MQRIIIFANGELPEMNKARAILKDGDYIICADGGTRHALALGLKPHLVIGDMDSTGKAELKKLRDNGVSIELYPRDKNETDLELAITRAVELEPKEIILVAALGGRIDQTLANISLLTDQRLSTFDLRLDDGVEEVIFCRAKPPKGNQVRVHGRSGDIVSLIAWSAPVHGVRTKELKWALDDETLFPESSRGVSNEMTSNSASIEIGSGLLLVIHRRRS